VSEAASRRLIVALDFDSLAPAYNLAQRLVSLAGMFKVGSRLFTAEGPRAVERLARLGPGIFLDLKFHDIPNIVAGAVSAAARQPGVRLITLHALGGREMMQRAARALVEHGRRRGERPELLAVTILTSMEAAEMRGVGIQGRPRDRAVRLARLARKAGLGGVVASAQEAPLIRRACGPGFLIIVPGVRPSGPGTARTRDDQTRVATPAEAIHAGADYLVVGRPITAATHPEAAAAAILAEISQALRRRI